VSRVSNGPVVLQTPVSTKKPVSSPANTAAACPVPVSGTRRVTLTTLSDLITENATSKSEEEIQIPDQRKASSPAVSDDSSQLKSSLSVQTPKIQKPSHGLTNGSDTRKHKLTAQPSETPVKKLSKLSVQPPTVSLQYNQLDIYDAQFNICDQTRMMFLLKAPWRVDYCSFWLV